MPGLRDELADTCLASVAGKLPRTSSAIQGITPSPGLMSGPRTLKSETSLVLFMRICRFVYATAPVVLRHSSGLAWWQSVVVRPSQRAKKSVLIGQVASAYCAMDRSHWRMTSLPPICQLVQRWTSVFNALQRSFAVSSRSAPRVRGHQPGDGHQAFPRAAFGPLDLSCGGTNQIGCLGASGGKTSPTETRHPNCPPPHPPAHPFQTTSTQSRHSPPEPDRHKPGPKGPPAPPFANTAPATLVHPQV